MFIGPVLLYDSKGAKQVRYTGSVRCLALSVDAKRLFSGNSDRTIKMSNLGTGK
jgi:WD40 repeat protein